MLHSFHNGGRGASHGFTLIEIMVVVAIVSIVMAVGVPMAWKALQRDDLARAIRDTIEGLKTARDRAILQGVPYEFIVRAEDGALDVQPAPAPRAEEEPFALAESKPSTATSASAAGSPYDAFPRKLGEDVMVQLIDVNFIDHMQLPEARVRFFPNGTCDEFTVVYAWEGEQRVVTVDIVTGLPEEIQRQ